MHVVIDVFWSQHITLEPLTDLIGDSQLMPLLKAALSHCRVQCRVQHCNRCLQGCVN